MQVNVFTPHIRPTHLLPSFRPLKVRFTHCMYVDFVSILRHLDSVESTDCNKQTHSELVYLFIFLIQCPTSLLGMAEV